MENKKIEELFAELKKELVFLPEDDFIRTAFIEGYKYFLIW